LRAAGASRTIARTMPTVALLEDDPFTHERLAGIVRGAADLTLAAAFSDLRGAMTWLAAHEPPQVMLVDLGLPDGSGVDVIRWLRRHSPATETMVISVFGDEQHVVGAIEAGATGYLLKDAGGDEIASAIRRLLAGESPISSAIARHLLRRWQVAPAIGSAAPAPGRAVLTPREGEVLKLIAKGLSYQRVADTLGMSPHTVTTHIKQIYRKLEVNSRGEAVFEAQQQGLLPPAGSS
jgi:DNA-binding NarL/FixJ family response regulator